MCVIFTFAPQATFNKRQLFNAVHNNWHGFGLVLRDGNNRLQVIKEFDENGTDPERVWKLLEDNKDITRYLHVRHSTKGATDETNVQPFSVMNTDRRQVFFMHNGTLTGFGGYMNNNTGKSDTLDFCEKILTPSLSAWHGPNGKADYHDENFLRLVVDKQWSTGSTGLFVSNDMEEKRLGAGWSEYKHPDDTSDGEVWVSNTTYFDRVQRGPHFQKLEEERKAREAEEAAKRKTEVVADRQYPFDQSEVPWMDGDQNGSGINIQGGIKLWSNSNVNKNAKVLKAIADIVNTWDLDDPSDIAKLKFVAYDEWYEYIEEESEYTVAALLEHLCSHLAKLQLELATLRRSKERAQKRLQEINVELKKEKKDVNAA